MEQILLKGILTMNGLTPETAQVRMRFHKVRGTEVPVVFIIRKMYIEET